MAQDRIRLMVTWLNRAAVLAVMGLSYYFFRELGSHWVAYERKMLRGVVYTLIWNIPFCAALVEWRAPWRHFLAGILFCSGIVTTFCAFSFNLMAVAGVVAIHGGTVLNLLFGKNDGNQRPVQTKT